MKSLEKCWLVSKYLQIYNRNLFKNIDCFQIFWGKHQRKRVSFVGWVGGRWAVFYFSSTLRFDSCPYTRATLGLRSRFARNDIFEKKNREILVLFRGGVYSVVAPKSQILVLIRGGVFNRGSGVFSMNFTVHIFSIFLLVKKSKR